MWHLHTGIILLNNLKKKGTVPQIHRSVYVNRLLKIDTLAQIARNLPSDLGIEILSHFFSSLHFSLFLSLKFRFSGFRVLLHSLSTSQNCFHYRVPEPHCCLKTEEPSVCCISIVFLMTNGNRNCLRMWIGYEAPDRHLSGPGWSSQTWLQISPAWLPGTRLAIHRQVPFHSAVRPGQVCFPSSPDDFKASHNRTTRLTPIVPILQRLRQEGGHEFETSLGYTVSCRPS